MGIKYSAMKLSVAVLRGIYAPMKLRQTKNRITIISRQSRKQSLDIALLSDYIRETFDDVECKVMIRFIEPGIANKIGYGFHILSQMWAMAASKVVVLDGYCIGASVLKHKPELKIVQMWHALSAIKKFGYQTIDKESGHSSEVAEAMCMHRNYDYVVAASHETGKLFCQGFNVDEDKLKYLGMPRIDKILETGTVKEEKDGREIIFYAPTFRKGEKVRYRELQEAIDSSRYRLIIKLHPLYDEEGISDKTHSTYEWLQVCDRIITDYSAIGVEASLVGKPLYYYVYDIDEYDEKVGLNINPEKELPGATARQATRLAEMIEEDYDYEALKKFRNKFVSVDTNNCTKQLGDFLHGLTG